MKISFAAALCAAIVCVSFYPAVLPAAAEDAAKSPAADKVESLKSWFGTWKAALKKKAIQSRYRRGVSVTSVAAVRGAKQADEDVKLPYWKGSWSEKKSEEHIKEREEQAAAVELILEGKLEAAEAALGAFEKAHPASGYLKDIAAAKDKLKELRAAQAPSAPAVPAPEAQPRPETVKKAETKGE